MNILPKKSWHVRNRKNIERVRRDEQRAAAEQADKERRALFAQREARIELLRKRAKGEQSEDADYFKSGDIFDSVVNEDDGELKFNVEHEREAKKEREAWEKKVGLLTYLGQSELEANEKPWYLKSHEARMKLVDEKHGNRVDEQTVDSAVKDYNDPLNDMKRYLEIMKAHREQKSSADKRKQTGRKLEREERHKHKHKKYKRQSEHFDDEKNNKEKEESQPGDDQLTKDEKLQKLRAERLKREAIEKERAKQLLLARSTPGAMSITDERKRAYNSQFYPHLAKQNL